jgi:hypothetical protein
MELHGARVRTVNMIDVIIRGRGRLIQKLQPSSSSGSCTMVRKQGRRIRNICKLVNGNWCRSVINRCSGRRHMSKRENILIEDDIARNIDSIGWDMQTFVAFM